MEARQFIGWKNRMTPPLPAMVLAVLGSLLSRWIDRRRRAICRLQEIDRAEIPAGDPRAGPRTSFSLESNPDELLSFGVCQPAQILRSTTIAGMAVTCIPVHQKMLSIRFRLQAGLRVKRQASLHMLKCERQFQLMNDRSRPHELNNLNLRCLCRRWI